MGTPDDFEERCQVCGNYADNCVCPECPVCGSTGDAACYEGHGLVRNAEQEASLQASMEAEAEEAAMWAAMGDAYLDREAEECA